MANFYPSPGHLVQHAAITNITTKTAIVAAPGAGKRVVVVGYMLTLDGAGEYIWESATTALSGNVEVSADTPVGMSSVYGVLECGTNEALNLTATAAANGHVSYIVTDA